MTDIVAVQNAVVASLQGVATLVTALGSADQITAFDPETGEFRTADEAIAGMAEDSILVIFEAMTQVPRGGIQAWGYAFRVAMFAPGSITVGAAGTHAGYFGLINAIIDGEAGTTGLRWYDSTIHPDFDPPMDPRFQRVTVDTAEVWHLTFLLVATGG